MSEPKIRIHTLRFSFGKDAAEPTEAEMFQFCEDRCFKPEDLYSVHKERESRSILVKFNNELLLNSYVCNLRPVHTFSYVNGTTTEVAMTEAGVNLRYVRIFNLPPELEDSEICNALAPFGTIRSQVREKYHRSTGYPVFSTVRGVYMEISKEIPSKLRFGDFQARLYHDGMVNKCFLCQSNEHFKVNCPRRNGEMKRVSVQGRLYSSIAAGTQVAETLLSNPESVQPTESSSIVLNKTKSSLQTITPIRKAKPEESTQPAQSVDEHITENSQTSTVAQRMVQELSSSEQWKRVPKRGRKLKKNEDNESQSSNGSEAGTPIFVPDKVFFLEFEQKRTRSKCKQLKIELKQEKSQSIVKRSGLCRSKSK
ncbi:uncharacterized protein LOC129750180 isoform X1 [Uranotaenia lowii]|uniref:uncharacterized protein LOC129750180 isoform X1 n=1 Tax=Uranotaenia lowii TaxID=190385 RepID=UPI002479E93A|nr:uncharacterized protein LOC129750180 isoform X1 [Uranotaenia lowii]